MKSKVNEVMEYYEGGFSCSQAIIAVYCEDLGLDKQTALKISCGFGAGMSRLSQTCGAVSGACLLIGLKYGKFKPGDSAAREKTYKLVQEFNKKFTEIHGDINCKELLCVDFQTGDKEFAAKQVQKLCHVFIKDAAEILEKLVFAEK